MEMATMLPKTVCKDCVMYVIAFVPFIDLCKESNRKWRQVADYLNNIKARRMTTKTKNIYVSIGADIESYTDTIKFTETKLKTPKGVLKEFKKRLNRRKCYKNKYEKEVQLVTTKGSKMSCPECDTIYYELAKFNKHIRNITKKMCRHCHAILNIESFENHLKEHDVYVFSCEICSDTFEREKYYLKHRARHDRGTAVCMECKQTFLNLSNLDSHMSKHRPDVCAGCDKKFTNKSCFSNHARICFNSVPVHALKFICDYCSKEYIHKHALRMHIKYNHLAGRQYQCDKCGKVFASRHHLDEHSNTHEKVKDRFVCNICKAKYSSRRGYERHYYNKHLIRTKSEIATNSTASGKLRKIRYKCHVCDDIFVNKKNRDNHLKIVHHLFYKKMLSKKKKT